MNKPSNKKSTPVKKASAQNKMIVVKLKMNSNLDMKTFAFFGIEKKNLLYFF